MKKKP
jgi:WD40 repeat protein